MMPPWPKRCGSAPLPLLDLMYVVLTPHIASASLSTRKAMANLAADNLTGYLINGKALTPLNSL